jgi:hypothetical protein
LIGAFLEKGLTSQKQDAKINRNTKMALTKRSSISSVQREQTFGVSLRQECVKVASEPFR